MKKPWIPAVILGTAMLGLSGQASAVKPEARCAACHTFEQGGKHKLGPNLFGIVGRKAGSTDFKKYGPSLKDGGWAWNEENLAKWLCDTRKAIKELTGDDHAKTRMAPQRLCGDRARPVISFLKTLK